MRPARSPGAGRQAVLPRFEGANRIRTTKKSPMETYGTLAPADPFARSRIGFESLVEDLAADRSGEMTHDQLEELIGVRGREVPRQLLQDHPGLRAIREQEALPAGRDQRRAEGRGRIERGHERGLATVFGPVMVRRLAYRALGRPSIYPAGAALSLPAGRHSHGLRRAAVCEAMRGSSGTAKAVIGRRCGRMAGKRQIEELVQAAAAGIGAFCARRVPVPCTSEVLLVLSADGKGIVMRPEGLRPATRKAAAGKDGGRGVFRTRLASGDSPSRAERPRGRCPGLSAGGLACGYCSCRTCSRPACGARLAASRA
jgi:hypothetical protein